MLIRSIRDAVLLFLLTFFLSCTVCFADFETDPFLDQRVKLDAPPIDQISEHIDPYSGNMQIVQTDLHLPGNGGLDLTIMRTYNSLIWNRRGIVTPINLTLRDNSALGTGWSMHMGLLRDADKNGTAWGGNPVFELPDGNKQVFQQDKNNTARLISKDYWVLNIITFGKTYEIISPQGIIYTLSYSATAGSNAGYLAEGTGVKVAQVIKIQNPAKTATISVSYQQIGSNLSYITQITDSLNRIVTFNYDTSTKKRLTSISTDSRVISYGYNTITPDVFLLSSVTPPVGSSWQYDYETYYELTGLTYPTGGKNTYTYGDINFYTGNGCQVLYRVVTQKQTSGRGIPSNTWTYTYNSGGTANKTVVSSTNVTETYQYWGWGDGTVTNGNVWKVGLPKSKSYNYNGSSLTENFTWSAGSAISNTQISNINWGCSGAQVIDSGVFPPQLATKTITRDGKTYTTTNNSFNTYGDPQTITETGDISRTKSIAYWTNPSKNIVKGKAQTLSVSASSGLSGSSSSSWGYDTTSGNPTSITHDGVTTSYDYYSTDGNLKSITDANTKTTTYEWLYGRISKATNPIYSVSREINVDGTIKSETNGRSFKTSYEYDKNLRPTKVTPPVGNATTITYASDSSNRTETRGSYSVQHTFDGFARPTGSSDSKGVTKTIAYKAYGVKDYTDSNIGEKVTFDYFGRPTQSLDKAGYSDSYSYSPANGYTATTITDKNSKTTVNTYYAFGNPDEKMLMSVKDQASVTTSYARNILGNVTGITQGSINRTFGYDSNKKAFLVSETHPETGNITYGRDNVGNMTSKVSATGTKNYTYDDINRLKTITSGSSVITLGYDNANNRNSMSYPGGSASFAYDGANRLTQKDETISGKSYVIKYSYDNNDNVQTITYPSNRVVTYGYNGNNQINSITGFGGKVSDFSYDKEFLKSFAYYNGSNTKTVTTNLTYNSRFLPDTNIAGSAVNIKYDYDTRGNTTKITNNLASSKTQTLGYDDLSRITSFAGAWGSGSYTYYDDGSRKSKSVQGMTTSNYTLTNNRLTSVSGGEAASYTYNGIGALSGGTWNGGTSYTIEYDAFDNLLNFKTGSTTLGNYSYDGDGMRVLKTAGSNSTVYHYGRSNQLLSETKTDGTLIADYVYMNGKLAAKVFPAPTVYSSVNADSFGNGYVNSITSEHIFTIQNTGSASLDISNVSIAGTNAGEFVKTSDTCTGSTFPVGSSCTIKVVFAAASVGSKIANLAINSNDPASPVYNIYLSGTGVLPSVSVTKGGTGTGTVSAGSGINCGSTCSATYNTNSAITLTAVADSCSTFTGWSGSCSGTGVCNLTVDSDKSVTATFSKSLPVASFSASPLTGTVPIMASFTSSSSCANSWSWSFGDGNTSNLQNPTNVYRAQGVYTASLTVTNEAGSNTATQTNYLNYSGGSAKPVRVVGGNDYTTIQAAYYDAVDGSTIKLLAIDIVEDFIANISKTVTIDGGYDSTFSNKLDYTNLHGNLTIQNGTVTAKDLKVK